MAVVATGEVEQTDSISIEMMAPPVLYCWETPCKTEASALAALGRCGGTDILPK